MSAPTDSRVAVVVNFVPPYRVPVFRYLAERTSALRIVVSTPMETNREWRPDWQGLDVVVARGVSFSRMWRHPSGFRERVPLHLPLSTIRDLSSFHPEVVISGEFGLRTLHSAMWCRRYRRPLVVWATLSERTEEGRGRWREQLRRFLLRRADGVIVNGLSGARYIAGFGYPRNRIHIIHQASPVRPPAGGAPAPDKGALRLLYVGRLVELKGLEPFVSGLARWCRSRGRAVRLTLVGPGSVSPSVASPDCPLLEVRATGPVPFEALSAHYQGADLLVFPTLADEWGLVVNEAMACGLPVLGSVHAQAVTELIDDDRTGWRYDPERPGQLEEALDRVAAAGRARLREMGAEAREQVAALTPETMAARIAAVVGDVLIRRDRESRQTGVERRRGTDRGPSSHSRIGTGLE